MLIINGTLVTPSGIRQESLWIHPVTGKISARPVPSLKTLDASGLYLYPGLINAHDHLELNHYPRTKFRPVYDNARFWADDMTRALSTEPFLSLQKYDLWEKCFIGGLKNLFSGVTMVAHHNPLHKPLKAGWFPVEVVRRYGWAHSLYLAAHTEIQTAYRRHDIFMIHLAEGTDSAAAQEFEQLEALGCTSEKTIFIHGVGLAQHPIGKVKGLVWCPSTNHFLLGKTAQVVTWFKAGKLALGSDSRLTAEGDLLDEMKAALATGQLSAPEIFHTVTDSAANLLNLTDRGDLRSGMQADIIALPQTLHENPYQALMQAQRRDLVWVMRGGKIIWQQDTQHPNCVLDGVPYRLAPALLKKAQHCRLVEKGLSIVTKI